MLKEVALTYFKVLSQKMPVRTREILCEGQDSDLEPSIYEADEI